MRRSRPIVNLTEHLEQVVANLCACVPDFAHIDSRRLLVCLSRARRAGPGGTYAKIIPMRYANGTPFTQVKGVQYALPQIPTPHGDVLYLIYCYLPRFFELPFERRLLTLIHELYHIAPAFDGTIRRVGRGAHGASRADFNSQLEPLAQGYLAGCPAVDFSLLKADFGTLARDYALTGRLLPQPKAVRLGV